jgi:photosystem II stability/assembly factor-like uncharacterized protein
LTFAPSGNLTYAWFDYYNTLFVSEDGGQSWSARPGHPDDYFSVATGTVAPDDSLTLAAEFPPQLLQIRNLDQSWRVLTESLPEGLSNVQAMAYDRDGAFLIGGQGGLFASRDQGQSWQSRNNGLPSEITVTLVHLANSHHFVVLSEGNILVSDDAGISWQDISVVR